MNHMTCFMEEHGIVDFNLPLAKWRVLVYIVNALIYIRNLNFISVKPIHELTGWHHDHRYSNFRH